MTTRRRTVTRLLLALAAAGCSSLTAVDAPDVVSGEDAANASGAEARWAGAMGSVFEVFASGPTSAPVDFNVVTYTGLLADELVSGDIVGLNTSSIDARRLGDDLTSTLYSRLHRARVALRTALEATTTYTPQAVGRIGQIYALLGYTNVWFAEYFCSGVPLTETRDGNVEYGQPLTTQELLQRAVALFDSAVAAAADTPRVVNLAKVGQGRAWLDLGDFESARASVAGVPSSFRYASEHSAAVQPNGIAAAFDQRRFGVADQEGGTGLDYRSAGDARIVTAGRGLGADNVTTIFGLDGVTAATGVAIASGVEARLIEAEAALQGSDSVGFLAALDEARAAQSLGPTADPGSAAGRVDLLFRERAFGMFLTGHRLGDLRRLVRQYGRSVDAVFPTGIYKDGVPRGSGVTFGVPLSENNNPQFKGCLSFDP
jgi:hypothetical protein